MKKINFESVFKIVVLVQLTIILVVLLLPSEEITEFSEPNEIGRYKDVKFKSYDRWKGGEVEYVRILDTKTGKYVTPSTE